MKVNFKQLSKKTLSCILALAVILCSVTVMFSAFAETEPEAQEPYTISYRSPAIPMFVGKQVLLTDLEVDFSEDVSDTYPADKVIWKHVEGDSVQILGGGFYAQKTGMTKFTATYGGKVQTVYVIVNEAGDYDFELVNLDLTKTGEGGYVAEDWITGGANVAARAYNETTGQFSTTVEANGYGNVVLKLNSGSPNFVAGRGIQTSWMRGILLYNSEILKDFADYTYTAGVYFPNYTDNSSATELAITATLITRANFNTNFTSTTHPHQVKGATEGEIVDTTIEIPTTDLFTSKALGVQFSVYGGVGITNLNSDSTFDDETNYWPVYQYHSEPLEKLNYVTDPENSTLDSNYLFRKTAGTDVFTVKVSGSDVKVDLNENYNLLDTTAETVRMSHFTCGRNMTPANYISKNGKNIITALDDISGDTLSTKIAEKAGMGSGTIGIMTSYTGSIYLSTVKVSLVVDTMPNLKDPSFYIVNSASPAIPMFVGKQVAVSDLAVEIGGELVSGADITWDVAQGSSATVLGDVIYAPETGKTKLTATYGDKVQNVWVIVNKANDYDFYLEKEDWKEDWTTFDENKWYFVTGSEYPNTLEYYHSPLPEDAGATWGYYYPRSATNSHFEFYYSSGIGMVFYKSDILMDFSDYTFSSTLLNNTDYSVGTSRGFMLRADVNFDAPIDDTTKVFNTSGLYLGQHRYGAPYIGSFGKPYMSGEVQGNSYHNMPTHSFHSLTGDDYYKFVNSTETMADSASAAITAGEWAGDPNYVMSMHSAGYQNAKVVTIKLEGTDILYKIGENTLLDTKAENIYVLRDYNQHSTAVNQEYDWDANTDKIVTNSGTIGFHVKQGMSHIYGFSVKLNDVSAENMPKMSNPSFFTVTEGSPAIPMYAGKFVYFNDIAVEFGNDLVSAKDIEWTVEEGAVMLINGGFYATGAGISKLTAIYKGVPKNVYIIANTEGDNTFYLVNENLKSATLPANTWYYADATFGGSYANNWSNGAVTSLVTTSDATNGYTMGNPWGGGNNSRALFYKSDMLNDFSDYTVMVSARHMSENIGGSFLNIVTRADLNDNIAVDANMLETGSTALSLGIRPVGGLSLYGFGTNTNPSLDMTLHTVSDVSLIKPFSSDIKYLFGQKASIGAEGNNNIFQKISIKLEGNNILYKLNDREILDTTKDIKTLSFYQGGGGVPTASNEFTEGTMTQYDYNKYIDGYNLGKGTVGLVWVRSGYYLEYFKVALNNDENNLPKMSTPSFYSVSASDPVIPMTAATKLDLGSFLVELGGTLVSSSSLTWSFEDAEESDIKVADGYVYAYERGTYTATITNGTVTDYIHFVVKNPDETEYVIYEGDYRAENADVSDWKTVVMTDNNVEFTGAYNSQDGKYITGNVASTINLPATSFKPHAFVPYDYLALGAAVGKDGIITTYTTLDNDILADLSDYTVVAGMRMYPNMRGAVGMVGRVSDTVDGLYTPGTSTAVGLASGSPSMYGWGHRYPKNQAFTVKGQSSYSALTNTDVNYYLSASLTEARAWLYRVFEIEYKGDKATYTAPNGATEVISGLAATKGTVAMFAESYDTASASYVAVPALADIKVVLNDIDISGLGIEKIDHIPAATPQKEVYVDKQNYSFEINPNGYVNGYVKLGDDSYSQKVFLPATIDGTTYKNWSSLIFSYEGSSLKPQRDYHGEVILGEGFQKSWGNGFRDNRNLYSITFPKTYTDIAGADCLGAVALQEVSFPEGSKLTSVGEAGFASCASLSSVKLPEGLKTIGATAFRNCKVLYDINIPSTVETIGAQAFEAVPFKNVTLPAATTSLGDNAFLNCTYLEKVYVLNASMTIGATAIPATATIYGYTGSTAEEYAADNGNTFVAIDNIESNEMAANTAFDLKQAKFTVAGTQVAGSDITWTAHRGADYEISNGWLLVYGEEDITITGTSAAGDVSINIAVAPKGTETGLVVKTFADKNMTIAPVANDDSAYTVKINETDSVALKYGTLTVTADNCDAVKIVSAIGDKGDTFGFKVIKPETMVLAAEYTTMAEREASIYPLGAQVRPATDTYSAGIRFITRFPEIKMEPAGIYLDEAYSQVGVLIIPYVLWDGTTIPDAEALSKSDVPMGRYNASNVVISKLMTANEAYADAAALLTGIPSSMYGVDIMALPYLIGTDGEVTYIEGDPMIKSYNDVLDASYPKYDDNVDNLFYGGTDHDIDADPATTAISYGLNEDISFIIRLKGDYQIKWSLYKDDPDVNAISELGEVNGSVASHVKSGTFTPGIDSNTLIVTTQMKQAGVVRLVFNLYDANGKAARVNENGGANNFSMSAAADYENITQSVEELFTAEQVMTEAKGYYEAWKTEWDTQVKVITDAAAADADFAAWLADNEKTAGAEKQVGELLKLKVAANNGTYTAYNFWIATGEEGLSTAGTENNRPATGVFSIPNTADNSLDMYATFTAWGGNNVATSGPQSGTLEVRVVGHGKDLGTAFDLNSGINTENPTQVFNYGILNRDYVTLQVAKSLFANKLKDNFGIKTNGGSMGGWRSVIIGAIDTDVNEFQVNIPWMCQVGAAQAGDITSWHPTYCDGLRPFSTVTAARIINERVAAGEQEFTVTITAGLGDYQASAPHGIIALYNAFDDAKVTKSLAFKQFKEHGATVYGSFTEFDSEVSNK